MAEPFKNLLDATVVRTLARALAQSAKAQSAKALATPFDAAAFERDAVRGLAELELMSRARHIAAVMQRHLPPERAVAVLVGALGPALPGTDEVTGGFRWLPISAYLEAYALDAPDDAERRSAHDAGLAACHALTQRFTAEWCIRPFLEARPNETLATLTEWTRDPSPHVRRLCSEGTRTRLPWGRRLGVFIEQPQGVFALLEHLRDDESEYVRRSVANNLNDLSKDHPDLVIATCTRWWKDGDASRRRLVKHALRTLVKKGDPEALAILGVDVEHAHTHVAVTGSISPKRLPIGGAARVSITATNDGDRAASVVIDLVVHYVKKSGKSSPKVFKGKTTSIAAGGAISFERTLSFADVSIRKHEPGAHDIEAKVSGKIVPLGKVTLTRS